MRVIRRDFFNVKRGDRFTVIPMGDVHIGSAACDEQLFREVVKGIAEEENCYWLGMGDYCEWINVRDPRFDAGVLADWVTVSDLVDLGKAQRDRFMDIVRPIAHKCLALLEGNHERTVKQHTERDVFSEIVAMMKGEAGLDSQTPLGVGPYGWLQLHFYRSKRRQRGTVITFNLHHGFVSGKLAGGKALNMQRWLWTHNADVSLWGHSHNVGIQPEAVESIDRTGTVTTYVRRGAFTGTFLRTVIDDGPATYSEVKGYFPLPFGGIRVEIMPGADIPHRKMIRISYEG